MIGIQLIGGLGNQIFEYVAARVLAQRLGCGFVVLAPFVGAAPWSQLFTNIRRVPLVGRAPVYAEIGQCFPAATQSITGMTLQLIRRRLRPVLFPHTFIPRRDVDPSGEPIELFDPNFFNVKSGTWLEGYFQSSAYFQSVESDVRNWLQVSPQEKAAVNRAINAWPAPADRMVAIHVRRGDYLGQKTPMSDPELGWALPINYYRNAIDALPPNLSYAVFSDDPAYAERKFKALNPWVAQGNSALRDLCLMSACRYMIIANSTLSWWAAWLNEDPEKIVLAPRFHLGWRIGRWYPGGIAVAGWKYIDAAAP